jgi:hypothetical protein
LPKQTLINAFIICPQTFWFATAKVQKKMYMCKKSYFFVVFKAVHVDYVGQGLIKFLSTASDVLGRVHLLCVRYKRKANNIAQFAKEANEKNRHSCPKTRMAIKIIAVRRSTYC